VLRALAQGDQRLLRALAREHGHPLYAANIGLSLHGRVTPNQVTRAMDVLEQTRGQVINGHLGSNPASPLTVADFGPISRRSLQPSRARRIAREWLSANMKDRLRPIFSWCR
jgi:hypothetical protein